LLDVGGSHAADRHMKKLARFGERDDAEVAAPQRTTHSALKNDNELRTRRGLMRVSPHGVVGTLVSDEPGEPSTELGE
jgi:hypothetical protein